MREHWVWVVRALRRPSARRAPFLESPAEDRSRFVATSLTILYPFRKRVHAIHLAACEDAGRDGVRHGLLAAFVIAQRAIGLAQKAVGGRKSGAHPKTIDVQNLARRGPFW